MLNYEPENLVQSAWESLWNYVSTNPVYWDSFDLATIGTLRKMVDAGLPDEERVLGKAFNKIFLWICQNKNPSMFKKLKSDNYFPGQFNPNVDILSPAPSNSEHTQVLSEKCSLDQVLQKKSSLDKGVLSRACLMQETDDSSSFHCT